MNRINKNNYEIYFIDYFDGNLNAIEKTELRLFLDQNPDLKKEFEEFEDIRIPANNTAYHHKENLKKSLIRPVVGINEYNYEDHFIAYHEGDLTKAEKEDVLLFLENNPDLKKEFELFRKATLATPAHIIYRDKKKLKKPPAMRRNLIYYSSAVAASLVLLFGIFSLFNNDTIPEEVRQKNSLAFMLPHKIIQVENNSGTVAANEINSRNIIDKPSIPLEYSREELAFNKLTSISDSGKIISEQAESHYPIFVFQRFSDINIYELHTEEYYAGLESKDRSLIGKILGNAVNGLFSVFSNRVDEIYERAPEDIDLWNIAEAGIESYNTLADRDVKLYKHYNSKGELVGFALLGDNIEYYRKLK